jgi:proteasome alpha subunit
VSMPFYVSPEQIIKDKADYARKGIARGRSVVVVQYSDGIAFVAENPSRALHKVSEIYDRIAFAAVGKYNEFENLRVAGVRLADMRGYSYDRRDVTCRALANAYAQTLGTIFTETNKPYEVEIVVAEVGAGVDDDQMYRLTFDGSVADERGFVAMGGQADQITAALDDEYADGAGLEGAIDLAVRMLGRHGAPDPRTLTAEQLEVAVLDRTRPGVRKFRRINGDRLAAILAADESRAEPAAKPAAAKGDAKSVAHRGKRDGAARTDRPSAATGDPADAGSATGTARPTESAESAESAESMDSAESTSPDGHGTSDGG